MQMGVEVAQCCWLLVTRVPVEADSNGADAIPLAVGEAEGCDVTHSVVRAGLNLHHEYLPPLIKLEVACGLLSA